MTSKNVPAAEIIAPGQPLRDPVVPPRAVPADSGWRWWAALSAGIGAAGVLMAIYLTLRPSSVLGTIPWFPAAVARWGDEYGRFRNFPAYALLALPCLIPCRRLTARAWTAAALAVLGGGLECAQWFIDTRWFEYQDIAWSWAGVLAAWAAVETVLTLRRNALNPRAQGGDNST